MYPGTWAERHPDRPALIMARSREVVTYAELDARSNRLVHLLRDAGLRRGDRAELRRLPTGKLYERLLRDRYWGERESRIV